MSNTHTSENPTYAIDIEPVGDHLRLTIAELRIVLETKPGQMKRDDAVEMALSAISEYLRKQDEMNQVKAS